MKLRGIMEIILKPVVIAYIEATFCEIACAEVEGDAPAHE